MNKDWFPSMRLNDLQSDAIKWERISDVYKFAHNINYLWLWVAGSTIVCEWKKSWIRMWFIGWLISACLWAKGQCTEHSRHDKQQPSGTLWHSQGL